MAKKRRKKSARRTRTKVKGFTKVKGKYALVFSKGKKLALGKDRYKSKTSLMSAARKYIK